VAKPPGMRMLRSVAGYQFVTELPG